MDEAGPAPQRHSLAPTLPGLATASWRQRVRPELLTRGCYWTTGELRAALMACFWSLPEAVRAREAVKVTPTGHL
jgi:hypothetical protein